MKRIFTLLFLLSMAAISYGQDAFQDDFESYAVGDYPSATSANWTTWSGTEGGAEDVRVTDAQAASGTNSIFFDGAGTGGPQDVILDFGGLRTSGVFNFNSKFFCESGKGAYFNFQGAENPGSIWSLNCFMNTDGSFTIDDGVGFLIVTTYPQDEWFELGLEINLTNNIWAVSMNGNCIGSFQNRGANALASLDLFPIDANFDFYVDDISYGYSETLKALDPAVVIDSETAIGFADSEKQIEATIVNAGSATISDLLMEYTIDGVTYPQMFADILLPPGASRSVVFDEVLNLKQGENVVSAQITSATELDSEPVDLEASCLNSTSVVFTGFTPEPGRKVFIEEATGTWCQWCPRGDVFMNLMKERYPDHFVGIAVHNADPMAVAAWDAGISTNAGFTGYPSAVVERSVVIDPSALETSMVNFLQVPAATTIEHGAIFDAATRELTIITYTTFEEQAIGDYRLVVGITEDGVTGTTTGYNQSNIYSGGSNGNMGGYENLPNPVPAAQMVYNHTSRALLTPYDGILNAFSPTVIIEPGTYEHGFTYVVPDEYDVDNLHIVSAILKPGRVVDNAQTTTIATSVDTKDVGLEQNISVSPNPTNAYANIRIQLDQQVNLGIVILDAMGQVVTQRNYGQVNGDMIYPIDVSDFPVGIYYARIQADDSFATKKIVVTK